MHTKKTLTSTIILISLLPLTTHAFSAFSVDEYRQSLLNAYSEVFSGICEPDRIDFKAADAELKPGAVAIEADQTELFDKKIVFTGNAELERDGMIQQQAPLPWREQELLYLRKALDLKGEGLL